jgi:plastocyanin domain-containing protein
MKLVAISVGMVILILQIKVSANALIGGAAVMPSSVPSQSFRQIEQPLPIKISVVVGGIILIGTEFWWFLGRK